MASPLINWDDFENQALVVQELLSHPEESAAGYNFTPKMAEPEDSSLIIFQIEEPQGLVLLSPDISLHTSEKIKMSTSPLKNVNVKYGDNQKDVFRTPLKDCTNNGEMDMKLLNDSTMITPVKTISSVESSNALCPSSAEFREFLSGIMEVSPLEKDGGFEALGGEAVKQCQSLFVRDSTEDVPVIKTRARSGTYNLASPTFDLGGLCVSESTTSQHDVALSTKPSPNLLTSDVNTNTTNKNIVSNESTIFPNDCFTQSYDDVKTLSKEDDNEEQRLEISENYVVDNCIQTWEDSTEVQKELLVDISDDSNANSVMPSQRQFSKKSNLRRPHLGLEAGDKSFDIDGNQNASSLQIVDPGPILLLLEESTCQMNVGESVAPKTDIESDKTIPDQDNKLLEKNELDCINENIVQSQKAELEEAKNEILNTSNSEDCVESQKTLATVLKVPTLKKNVSTASLPNKDSTKAESHTSNILPKKASNTKLPFMRSKLALKRPSIGLTNSTSHPAESKAVQDGEAKESDAVKLPNTIAKPCGHSSLGNRETLGASKILLKPSFRASSNITDQSQGESSIQQQPDRLRMKTTVLEEGNCKIMKPQDLHSINLPKKPCASKLATKIVRKPSMIKGIINASTVDKDTSILMKPQSVIDASRTVSKDTRKIPLKSFAPADGFRTVTKKASPVKALFPVNGSRTVTKEDQPLMSRTVTKDQPAMSRTVTREDQPALSRTVTKDQPAMSRTVTREDQPALSRTITKEDQPDLSRTVTKEDQPMLSTVTKEDQPALSRTVTKEDQPALSRTVTKEDQPALSRTITKEVQPTGFRTVTKTSEGQSSNTSRNHLNTPLKSEKLMAPRRLSNVFHTPSSLSNIVSDKRKNSSILPPRRLNSTSSHSSQGSVSSNSSFRIPSLESPFPDTRSRAAECEAFKVDS